MKYRYWILLFLLTVNIISVNGAVAGTPQPIIIPDLTINNCTSLNVTVYGAYPIDYDEYNLENCELDYYAMSVNFWICDCKSQNPFKLIMNTNELTVNNYSMTIEYSYEELKNTFNPGGSGFKKYNYVNITKVILIDNSVADPNIIICEPGKCPKAKPIDNIPINTRNNTKEEENKMTTTESLTTTTTILVDSIKEANETISSTGGFSIKTTIIIVGGIIVILTATLIAYSIWSRMKKRKLEEIEKEKLRAEREKEVSKIKTTPTTPDICSKCMGEIIIKEFGSNEVKVCKDCNQAYTLDMKEIPYERKPLRSFRDEIREDRESNREKINEMKSEFSLRPNKTINETYNLHSNPFQPPISRENNIPKENKKNNPYRINIRD